MKNNMPKVISLAVAISLAVSLSACGGNNDKASGSTADSSKTSTAQTSTGGTSAKQLSATLKILYPGDKPAAQDAVDKAVSEKLKADGLDFTFEYTFAPTNDIANKAALIAASGEDMDIQWSHAPITMGVTQGMYAPLDDALKDYGQELLKTIPEYAFKEVSVKGKTYAIPRVVPAAENDWVMAVRGDLREKYGVPEIKTIEDFEKYAQAIHDNEKQMTPICLSPREFFRALCPTYYFPASGSDYFYPLYIDQTDPNLTVKNFLESDIYKKFCDMYYSWVQKGWATKDTTQLKLGSNDFIAGKIGTNYANAMWPTEKIDKFHETNPTGKIEIVSFNPEQPRYIQTSVDNVITIFSQSKHVNEAVAFINWVRTNQENYDLYTFGVKDVNYKLDGDAVSYEGITKENEYFPNSYIWTDLRFQRYSKNLDPSYLDVIKNWDKGAIQSPLLGISFDMDIPAWKDSAAKLQTVHAQYSYMMQKGLVKYDDKKAEMLKKAKDAGIDELIKEVQKQVDAFKADK